MTFGEPAALLGLLALIPAAQAMRHAAARRREAAAAAGGGPSLRRGLSARRRRIHAALLLTAAALTAIAVARPQWGSASVPVTREGIDVVVALDISRSMTAADIAPSRAGAAAAGLRQMLEHLRGDRVGLVTFAGSAFDRSPLTLDLRALAQIVDRAQAEAALVRPGTDIGTALDRAIALLAVEDRAETQVIVLVSDGEDFGARLNGALSAARDGGIRVYTVAAGTDAGAAIPSDGAGSSEQTRLDRATLDTIARQTGGNLRDTNAIAGLAVEFAGLRQSQFDQAERPAPVERFQWFLGGALALLMAQGLLSEAGPRRPLTPGPLRLGTSATLAAVAALAALALAACGSGSARQHVDAGNADYAAARYEQALTAYGRAVELLPDDPVIAYDTGNALHSLRRFEEAAVASAAAATAAVDPDLYGRATYALGSHAFRRGALVEARSAFIDVLVRDPSDGDARHNLEIVLDALEEARAAGQPSPDQPAGQPEAEPPPTAGTAAGTQQPPGSGPGATDGTADGPAGGAFSPGGAPGDTPGDPEAPGGATAAPAPVPADSLPGSPEREQALEAARQALLAGLAAPDRELTLDEALALLDLVRRANALEALAPSGAPGGALPAR